MNPTRIRKTSQLRRLIASPELQFLCEAHNGISGRIVEESGCLGIWASGLTIAAAMGVRDNNELSWTQVLDVLEHMNDATTIPILVDCDTGYGNFNNFRRFVKKLEARGLAGACIEDKIFPKTNSFLNGQSQCLATMEEVCGKLRAAKDTQTDQDFVLVARTEAFVSGTGLRDALQRAEAYRMSGADAILVHSKRATCEEIELFSKEWASRHPLVIVPTTYFTTPTSRFRQLGISLVVWANHLMRAAILAMQRAAKSISDAESVVAITDKLVPIKEVFRLQETNELEEAEKRYLPNRVQNCTAIILAGAKGKSLREQNAALPTIVRNSNQKPSLHGLVHQLKQCGAADVVIIDACEERPMSPELHDVTHIYDDLFPIRGEVHSLYKATTHIKGRCLFSYNDRRYRDEHLQELMNSTGDIRMLVDCDSRRNSLAKHLVICSQGCSHDFLVQPSATLTDIATAVSLTNSMGEWTGLLAVTEHGADLITSQLETINANAEWSQRSIPDLLKALIAATPITVVYIRGGWLCGDDLN